jgi:disulfide bond formation protein DsbB
MLVRSEGPPALAACQRGLYIQIMPRFSLPLRPELALVVFSTLMLLGALGFQYLGGLAPCELCMDQRYAHVAAVAAGLAALALGGKGGMAGRIALALGLLALVVGAGIAIFHAGVEQRWWRGLESCSAAGQAVNDIADLIARIEAAPVVRCDEIAWQALGISMAGWNALASLAAAAVIALSTPWKAR